MWSFFYFWQLCVQNNSAAEQFFLILETPNNGVYFIFLNLFMFFYKVNHILYVLIADSATFW